MNKKFIVKLTDDERKLLEDIVNKGKAAAHRIKHANILLKTDSAKDSNWSDEKIAESFGCHTNSVKKIRETFVEQGFDAALERKKRENPPRVRILDGKGEAHLLAIACSKAPEGNCRWTLQLLADQLIELKIVDLISDTTIFRVLKKTKLNRT